MDVGKVILYIIVGFLALGVAWWALKVVLGVILGLVVPLAVLGVVGYIIWRLVGPKSLGGSGRSLP